jgi:hypothetical protein
MSVCFGAAQQCDWWWVISPSHMTYWTMSRLRVVLSLVKSRFCLPLRPARSCVLTSFSIRSISPCALANMPPQRGTKRATSPDEETKSRPSVKRSKSSTNSDVAGYPWTNKGIPDTLTFTPSEEKIRISAWNVCGLTACWKKASLAVLYSDLVSKQSVVV